MAKSTTMTVRLAPEVSEKLEALAHDTRRSKAYLAGEAIASYDVGAHPIARTLLEGGPYALARFAATFGFEIAPEYVDACHLCYRAREFLRSHFPELLGPDEMYGV